MASLADHIVGGAKDRQKMKNTGGEKIPVFKIFSEELEIQEHSSIIKTRDMSNVAIWDSPNSTWDGADNNDKWDGTLPSWTVVEVTNPNNVWKEAIRDTTFKDADNTTATWDTTNHKWTF